MAILTAAQPMTDDSACAVPWLIGLPTQSIAVAGPPTDATEFILKAIRRDFDQLDTPIEVFEARFTGEIPAIGTGPAYDVSGLEAEPGVHLSMQDALRIGRRLQRTVSAELEDIDIDY